MLFQLKKFLTLLVLPLSLSLILGAIGGALLYSRRWQKSGRLLITASVLVLLLASNKGVAILLLRSLENQYSAVPTAASRSDLPESVQSCRAIVILGGGHSDSPTLSRVNQLSSASLSRVAEGVRLSRLLPEAAIVVSGHHGRGATHAQVLGEAAASLGVSPDRILRFDWARDTEDEVMEVKRRFGDAPILLVTSAWHMPRAMEFCRRFGVRAIPAPADFMLRPGADRGTDLLRFDLGALERSTKAIHERVGLLWIKLKH